MSVHFILIDKIGFDTAGCLHSCLPPTIPLGHTSSRGYEAAVSLRGLAAGVSMLSIASPASISKTPPRTAPQR